MINVVTRCSISCACESDRFIHLSEKCPLREASRSWGRANTPRSKNWSIDERRGGEIQLYSVIVLPDHSMGVSPISYALSSNELRNIKETCADTWPFPRVRNFILERKAKFRKFRDLRRERKITLAWCYENPLRGNGRENGFWNKRKGSVIFLFSFNAWKIAHWQRAFNSWIRKFDPIFGRLLSSPSAVRIYPTRLRDWKLFSLAGETRKTRGKMEGGSWDEWSIAVERPTSCKSVTSDFIRPPLPPPLPPGFAPRGEKKSLAYGTWKDSYSLVYVLREGKKKKKIEKKKNTSSPELSIPSDLSYI